MHSRGAFRNAVAMKQKKHIRKAHGLARARALGIAMLFVSLAPAASAQGTPGEADRLGVYEAIRLAHASSPALNQLRRQIDAKSGERWSAFGLPSPELLYFREGIPTGGSSGYAEQRWAVSQSIDFPLQSYYRVKKVGTEQEALLLQLEAASLRLKADVKKAYTDLLYAQEMVHLREQEVVLSEGLQQAVAVRTEAGESSGLDQIKAEIQLAEAQSNMEEAHRQFQNARYALFNVIGLDPADQRYQIQFPDTLVYFQAGISQEQAMGRLESQPELRGAARMLDAARLGVRQTRSRLLPDIRLDYYPQDYGGGFKSYGFQVGLKIPLWFMLNHRGEMQMARARQQSQVWEQKGIYLDLKKQVEQAWHSYEISERALRRYHETVRERAEELLRLTREGYQMGELDLLTLLDTQRTYLSSQKRYYDTLHDYYFYLIDLERFLGEDLVFNPDVLKQYSIVP